MNYYRFMPITYDVQKTLKNLPWPRLASQLDTASRAMARADERLKQTPDLSAGLQARAQFIDTCAAMALDGELVHLEDLVLHDSGADRRAPTHELTRAARLLGLRRRIDRQGTDTVLTRPGVLALIGHQPDEPGIGEGKDEDCSERGGGLAGPAQDTSVSDSDAEKLFAEIDLVLKKSEQLAQGRVLPVPLAATQGAQTLPEPLRDQDTASRLDGWLQLVEDTKSQNIPPLLTAAILLDSWQVLRPVDNWPELGRFLTEKFLKSEVTPNHLPMLCVGLRKSPFRWRRSEAPAVRLAGLLAGFERAAVESMDQLDRLQLAQDRLTRCCRTSRRHSKLPAFTKMFLNYPLVTIPMARQDLGVTAAAVDRMIEQLGSALPRELTGRSRYRAWGIL
ncbi:RHE_PE00001 family protein [Roseibium sp.]|uniref:RHE_PE00001 family protein n=1 Tax=Roseibium sp. TaxID=1936156 RepID=UPI003D1426EE